MYELACVPLRMSDYTKKEITEEEGFLLFLSLSLVLPLSSFLSLFLTKWRKKRLHLQPQGALDRHPQAERPLVQSQLVQRQGPQVHLPLLPEVSPFVSFLSPFFSNQLALPLQRLLGTAAVRKVLRLCGAREVPTSSSRASCCLCSSSFAFLASNNNELSRMFNSGSANYDINTVINNKWVFAIFALFRCRSKAFVGYN